MHEYKIPKQNTGQHAFLPTTPPAIRSYERHLLPKVSLQIWIIYMNKSYCIFLVARSPSQILFLRRVVNHLSQFLVFHVTSRQIRTPYLYGIPFSIFVVRFNSIDELCFCWIDFLNASFDVEINLARNISCRICFWEALLISRVQIREGVL